MTTPQPFTRLARLSPLHRRLLLGVLALDSLCEQALGARDATMPLIRLGPALVLLGLLLCAPGEMAGFAFLALAVDMLVMVSHPQTAPVEIVLHGLCMVGVALVTAWGLRRRMARHLESAATPDPGIVSLRGLLDLATGGVVMALPLALADAALSHGHHGVSTANLLFGHIGPIVLGVVTLLALMLGREGNRGQAPPRRHAPAPLRALLPLFPALLVSASFVWPTPVLAVLMPVAMATVTLELTLREALLSIMLAAITATGMAGLIDLGMVPGPGHGAMPPLSTDALDAVRARWLSWMMGAITLSVAVNALRQRAHRAETMQAQTMALLDALPEAAFRADRAGRWTWLSPGWAALGGQPPIGRPMVESFARNQRERLRAAIARLGDGGGLPVTLCLTLESTPDAPRQVEISLAAIPGEPGLGGIIRDVTRSAEAMDAARHAQASWHELCDAAPVAIMRCDPQGIVTYANWAAELTALGSQAPLLGRPLRAWLGDDPAFDVAALDMALSMPCAQITHERETGSPARRTWLSVTVTAKFDAAGRRLGYIVAAVDITARKQLERDLIEARHKAETAALDLLVRADSDDTPAGQASPLPARALNVLVAGSNLTSQIILASMLERLGHCPAMVGDGSLAVERVAQASDRGTPFDVVLMDMDMQVMGGLEATRALRAAGHVGAVLPIVAITDPEGHGDGSAGDLLADCLAAGMQGVLARPLGMGRLAGMLDRVTTGPTLTARPPRRADVP